MKVVVKIGSRVLTEDAQGRALALAAELAELRREGHTVLLVTSGAIALGLLRLGLAERPRELPRLQAAAAVGQGALMKLYEEAFLPHGLKTAQVLLTHEDLANRERYLNARHTFAALLELGVVPIVNENDTVAVEEIKLGDNDRLAALVAALVEADWLVILTDVDGLLDNSGRLVSQVSDLEQAAAMAGGANALGTGGMTSKVLAAGIALRAGVEVVVASGRVGDVIKKAVRGDDLGTRFPHATAALTARKHWIAYTCRPAGALVVDEGARRAIKEQGSSLLPSGIVAVRGSFSLGETVSIVDQEGVEFARGLCSYTSDEVERIRGHHSREIEAVLGYEYLDCVIHRDELVLL